VNYEHDEILGDMQRRMINMMRMGRVDRVDPVKKRISVNFGKASQWCRVLVSREKFLVLPDSGDQVFVLFPYGDLTCGYVCGSLPGDGKDVVLHTDGVIELKATKIRFQTDSEDLISLICEALQIIATSKTPTPAGPQMSLENSLHLPGIISRLRSFSS
jgi:hypothetical protein